jgi:CBS domain containing-hemolysin-like protein
MFALVNIAEIVGLLLIIALNGFFVAAEFAIVKVRSTQIEPLARKGVKRARIAQHIIGHLDAYLSACQLGVTMTSLALGWVGEPYLSDLLLPVFNALGIAHSALISTVSFAVAFTIITYVHIVLGEQAPKWVAIQYAQPTALLIAPPLHAFYRVFRPFIWVLNSSVNGFLRIIGIPAVSGQDLAQSEEELRLILSKGQMITSTGKSISLRAMELRKRTVREVMVPRTSIVVLYTGKSIRENLTAAIEHQFTRYPLCEGNLDTIVGMIHLKDLFKLKGVEGPGTTLLEIKREMPFVPETTSLERMLNLFLARRILMAVAVDEYGGTAGLVTLENVLEELVGEIRDEFDVEPILVHKLSEGEFLVDGSMPLLDFARTFTFVPETKEALTVSGYVIHKFGQVPVVGGQVQIDMWDGVVEAMDGMKVKTLRLRRHNRSSEQGGSGA